MMRPVAAGIALCALVACSSGGAAKGGGSAAASPGSGTQAVATSASSTVAHEGQPAPDWTEATVGGGTLTLSSLKGKAVYLNFFATWCPPCNEEAASINELQEKYGRHGLRVVGVDVLENAAKAEEFRDAHKLVYPAVADSGALRDQYNINGLPVHVFIQRDGVVHKIIVGELSKDEMEANIEQILH
jgi:cytochrome c biogenesis protein CcmG, thiol:disulfide interchange protein DsbE